METGLRRLDDLYRRFPEIPRSIVLKADLLCRGLRLNRDLLQIGKWATPEFLSWDTRAYNSSALKGAQFLQSFLPPSRWADLLSLIREWQKGKLISDYWAWLPQSFSFKNGLAVKTLYDFLRHHPSPYEIKKQGESFWLYADNEPLEEVFFNKRPEWYFQTFPDGRPLASVLFLSSPDCLLGFPIRFCDFHKPEDICRFCCLGPSGQKLDTKDTSFDTIMKPEAAAHCFKAALAEMGTRIKHIDFTGGTILAKSKEAEIYAGIYQALDQVRREKNASVSFCLMSTALDDEGQAMVQNAGVNEVSFNTDVWPERLWSELMPGKNRQIGRQQWLERLKKAAKRFGTGHVLTQFVLGLEMIAEQGFRQYSEGQKAVFEGMQWCLGNGVQPDTIIFQNTPGSFYEDKELPQIDYFLEISLQRHDFMKKYKMYDLYAKDSPLPYRGQCHLCDYLSLDTDFYYLSQQTKPT